MIKFKKKSGNISVIYWKLVTLQSEIERDSVYTLLIYIENNILTKAEILNTIDEETGIAKKDVAATVEAFMEEIRVSLAENKENVYLRGFGTFTVKHRAAKTARNISKNTTLVIDAHDFPAFKPSKSFIEKMKK